MNKIFSTSILVLAASTFGCNTAAHKEAQRKADQDRYAAAYEKWWNACHPPVDRKDIDDSLHFDPSNPPTASKPMVNPNDAPACKQAKSDLDAVSGPINDQLLHPNPH